eukprot:scaffold39630_cov74-Cyclotella_meneghiniana.AAC.1
MLNFYQHKTFSFGILPISCVYLLTTWNSLELVDMRSVYMQEDDNKDTSIVTSTFTVAEYTFPTVEERLEYYMGDWYEQTNWSVPDCKVVNSLLVTDGIRNNPMLLSRKVMKECAESDNRKRDYCFDAHASAANLDATDIDTPRWLFTFGENQKVDIHSQGGKLPIIAKARPSMLSSKSQPIIWLLNVKRHYVPVEYYHREIRESGLEVPWSEKEEKVFWRGSPTGQRKYLLSQWINYDPNQVDVAFFHLTKDNRGTKFMRNYIDQHYVRAGKHTLLSMNRYKYLLNIEGNDSSSGITWMLYSNSVVFMSRPSVAAWAMEDLLIPFVHYIPLADDYSNLLEMLKWAKEHDQACQEISSRATEFMEHLWMSDQAQEDTKYLQKTFATRYASQFGNALTKCADNNQSEGDNRQGEGVIGLYRR